MALILLIYFKSKKPTHPVPQQICAGRDSREEAMYSSAIAPHALFVLPYENNDDDCGSAAPLQDVAELRLPVFPLDDEDDDIVPLLAAMPPHTAIPASGYYTAL